MPRGQLMPQCSRWGQGYATGSADTPEFEVGVEAMPQGQLMTQCLRCSQGYAMLCYVRGVGQSYVYDIR